MSIRKKESKKAKNGYTWEVAIKYKDIAGKTKWITKRGFTKRSDAEEWETRKRNEINNHINIKHQKHTFDEIFQLYIVNDPFTRDSTKHVRSSIYNKHLKNTVGKCDIAKLDYEYIQNFLNKKAKTCTKNTIQDIYKILNGVFNFAFNNNYIIRKPYAKLKLNGIKTAKSAKTVPMDTIDLILDNYSHPRLDKIVEFDNYKVAIQVGLYTGVRISECCGLKREDVDLENNVITINKQLQFLKGDLNLVDTKTEASIRKIGIAKELHEVLEEHFRKYPESEYVVCDKDMGWLSPSKLQKSINRACQKLGVTFHYHMLRHMFITQLYNKGVDIMVTQKLAGHAHYQTTADIYTELDEAKTSTFDISNLYN